MTTRVLPPDEYARLYETEARDILRALENSPGGAQVLVVEAEGRIVGMWLALVAVHVEGLWVDERYRGTSVSRRLWRGMRALVRTLFGVDRVLTCANTDDIRALLQTAGGTRLDADLYELPLNRRSPCPSS